MPTDNDPHESATSPPSPLPRTRPIGHDEEPPRTATTFTGLFGDTRPRGTVASGREFRYPTTPTSPIGDIYCTATTLNRAGRVGERSAIKALGWPPRQPVAISPHRDLVIVRASTVSRTVIGPTGYLTLPFRSRCQAHLGAPARVLLAAALDHRLLIVCSTTLLAEALHLLHPQLWQRRA